MQGETYNVVLASALISIALNPLLMRAAAPRLIDRPVPAPEAA